METKARNEGRGDRMRGSSMKAVNNLGLSGLDDAGIVRRLALEFGAPVALLDVAKGTWLKRAGAPDSAFPEVARELANTAIWVGTAESRATLWRPDQTGLIWLVMPLK